MRLIDSDALIRDMEENPPSYGDMDRVIAAVNNAPTIEFGKDNTVLCKPTPDDPFCLVIVAAVRYCLGRRTYMPDVVTRWIMASVPELPAETAKILLRDINDQRRFGERIGKGTLGDPCDVKTWETFESWLHGRVSDGV